MGKLHEERKMQVTKSFALRITFLKRPFWTQKAILFSFFVHFLRSLSDVIIQFTTAIVSLERLEKRGSCHCHNKQSVADIFPFPSNLPPQFFVTIRVTCFLLIIFIKPLVRLYIIVRTLLFLHRSKSNQKQSTLMTMKHSFVILLFDFVYIQFSFTKFSYFLAPQHTAKWAKIPFWGES